jgi:hypothetical protein
MLAGDFSPDKLEAQLKNCCSEHKKCSDDLNKLAEGIEELARLRPAQLADRVGDMEKALVQKCHQIKESRALITQLISQAATETKDMQTQMEFVTKNAETQIITNNANFGQQADTAPKEIIKEVEKIVFQTIEKILEVEKIIERPIFTERVVIVEKIVPVTVEVERIQIVEKIIELPVETTVIQEVEKIKEVVVEVIKTVYVDRIVEKPVEVIQWKEKIIEREKIIEKPVIVEKIVEVAVKEVVIKEVERVVEVPVEKIVYRDV